MRIVPQSITLETLISSTVVDDYELWDANAPYSPSEVLDNSNVALYGEYYYRAVANSEGAIPPDNEGSKWVKWGVSNKQAMFDLRSTTSSRVENADIVVEFDRGFIDSIVIGNYIADSVKIEVVDKISGQIYDTIIKESSVNQEVYDQWDYMYVDYSNDTTRGVYFELGRYEGGIDTTKIRVTIYQDQAENIASCGYLIAGEYIGMGETMSNVNFSFNSYSTKETDTYGIISITKRGIQDLVDFETKIPREESTVTKNKVKKYYDEITAFVLDESETSEFDNMTTLGTVSDVSTVVTSMNKTVLTWSIQETI